MHSIRDRAQKEITMTSNITKVTVMKWVPEKVKYWKLINLTNWKWFSMVCSPIDRDICHHSSQNVTDSWDEAKWMHNKFWPLWWGISLLQRVLAGTDHANHCGFVFYHNSVHDQDCDMLMQAGLSVPLLTTANWPIRLQHNCQLWQK